MRNRTRIHKFCFIHFSKVRIVQNKIFFISMICRTCNPIFPKNMQYKMNKSAIEELTIDFEWEKIHLRSEIKIQ